MNADLSVAGARTLIERVPVVANLRHHDIEPVFNEETLDLIVQGGGPDFAYRDELTLLWEFACVCEAGRGKPAFGNAANQAPKDYTFDVDWSASTEHGPGRVAISERKRGSPLDKLVAELMIVANQTWGKHLADAGVAAIYRAQSAGKVRMTTVAAPHEGLGVDQYAWSSSPLRRYVDLLNQWQLIACLQQREPRFGARSEALLAALRDFELTYAAYAEFQRSMERYWCLRWLLQEERMEPLAWVVRESLVRVDGIPLYLRLPSLPACAPGTRVRLIVESIDLVALEARCRFVELLPTAAAAERFDPAIEAE